MAIPESQLETWSHQGSITQSSTTFNSIKNVLESSTAPYADKQYEVFLQGSYGNDTNVYAESDVDIIIRLDECFQSDLCCLTEAERTAYHEAFSDATYNQFNFKHDVLTVLTDQYGDAISVGDKAISIESRGSRRSADVIAAVEYRHYHAFQSAQNSDYIQGVCFWTASGQMIANFPKQHSSNLTAKHQRTSQWLKPLIRVFKNMRRRMVDDGLLNPGVAPSYFIEGLLYNVPDKYLRTSYATCVVNTLNWYILEAEKSELLCANEQYYLLRDGEANCWNEANCDDFVASAVNLWNDW